MAFQVWRARRAFFLVLAALLVAAGDASAQSRDDSLTRSLIDEVRLGLFVHHIEPAGTERGGQDVNLEMLFSRPALAYANSFDAVWWPRLHLGSSINVNGETSQLYSGFTWNFPLVQRLSLELTFGGSLHNGPDTGPGSAFGCPLNFRESGSIGYAVTEHWRIYGTVAHMSNAGLCERNSGITSAGMRLGYVFN
jgi:lipid A 3-O-deacylase